MEYEYKNLKSNKIIKFNIDEKFAFIYGPNGTGKTTFSRAIGNGKRIKDKNINKIHLVFNQDFINNNIYILVLRMEHISLMLRIEVNLNKYFQVIQVKKTTKL